MFTESSFEDEEAKRLLNEIICEHFLRQGKLDIAEALNEVKKTTQESTYIAYSFMTNIHEQNIIS